jgi:hypothetical protein
MTSRFGGLALLMMVTLLALLTTVTLLALLTTVTSLCCVQRSLRRRLDPSCATTTFTSKMSIALRTVGSDLKHPHNKDLKKGKKLQVDFYFDHFITFDITSVIFHFLHSRGLGVGASIRTHKQFCLVRLVSFMLV